MTEAARRLRVSVVKVRSLVRKGVLEDSEYPANLIQVLPVAPALLTSILARVPYTSTAASTSATDTASST
jgi:hypothetical protein